MRHSFVLEQNPASNAVALQVFFTQYAAQFAEKTHVYACEDRILILGVLDFLELDLHLLRCAVVADNGQCYGITGIVLVLYGVQLFCCRDLLILDCGDDIRSLNAGLICGTPVCYTDDIGTHRNIIGLRNGFGYILAGNAQLRPSGYIAVIDQIINNALGFCHRDCKADAFNGGTAAGVGGGHLRGVDANHLAGAVDQRAAGVTVVDGRICLNQGHSVVIDGDLPVQCRDNAAGNGVLEFQTQRVTDCHYSFADRTLGAVSELCRCQIAGINFQHCDICFFIVSYDARIVAYDKEADIAVLKIDASDLTPAEFGDSSKCAVGETVVAIGNPLGLEFQNTVTCGIISALNRKVTINDNTMTLIQTDTAINNGNSGGPLINSSGQVIGINSAKMSSTYSSSSATIEGIGFAIPMTEAKSIIDDLINYGYVTGRPQLGITCQDVTEAVSQAYNIPVGAYVISVTDGGAADQAGIQAADVITAIQDQEISTTEELNAVKNQYNAGDTITLTIVRNNGTPQKVEVKLQEVKNTQN